MSIHRAGVPLLPDRPDPNAPRPDRNPLPEGEPQPQPWEDPNLPGRKVNLPSEQPLPGPPIETVVP